MQMEETNMDFSDKTVIITGGSSGIGRRTAFAMAERGATVINADVQPEPREDGEPTDVVIENRGSQAKFVQTDVTELADVRSAVDVATENGGVDVVVNNAGQAESYAITDTSPDNWEHILRVNLTGVYHGCLAGVEAMLAGGGGAIVNVASVFGVVGGPNAFSYSAAKGGVIALTRQLARDYARDDIRVNAVSPGFLDTQMLQEDTHEGTVSFAEGETPMGRIGTPEDVAVAITFLASDAASYITGQNLAVDGGYSTV